MNSIQFRTDKKISGEEFIDVLRRSTLAERRPVDEKDRIDKMLHHSNILVTAWDGDLLVGVSRALSDFAFCCYLSDLAVDETYQHKGIGKKLIELTHEVAGKDNVTLILLSAPKAIEYYPKIGMDHSKECFVIKRKK